MKTKERDNNNDPLVAELEEIKTLLQDLLIFQSLKSGIPIQTVRAMVKLNTDRVTHISKGLNKAKK